MKDLPNTAAVIGYPVQHSLSPVVHRYWLKRYNIQGDYITHEVKPEQLEAFLLGEMPSIFCGINITLPFKESAFYVLEEYVRDEAVRRIGAVNTVFCKDGEICDATNTDWYGFEQNILQHVPGFFEQLRKSGRPVMVLGAGGAARGVLYCLYRQDIPVILSNRTQSTAEALKAVYIETKYGEKIQVIPWEQRELPLMEVGFLVNTTSLGMLGKPSLNIPLTNLHPDAVVTDIVYVPLKTELLKEAEGRGNRIVDGLGMLLHQAVPGFEGWFGKKPEVTQELRNIVLEARGHV